ncbi:hypothetical protein ScPMuIL_005791 [Solemya velum]
MSVIDSEVFVPSDTLFGGNNLVEMMMTYAVEFMQDRLQTLDKITEINLSFAEKWGKRIPDLKSYRILTPLWTEALVGYSTRTADGAVGNAACTARLRDALGASHGPISQLKRISPMPKFAAISSMQNEWKEYCQVLPSTPSTTSGSDLALVEASVREAAEVLLGLSGEKYS